MAHINKIDELLDGLLDDFYVNIVKLKKLVNFTKETNFVKFHTEINNLMSQYIDAIDLSEVKKVILSNNNVVFIIETFKRYIAYYLYIIIGVLYSGGEAMFDNNIVEITKNQGKQAYKIQNFYTSESTSNILKFTKLARKVQIIVESEKTKQTTLMMKEEYSKAFELLKLLGNLAEFLSLSHAKNDESLQWHNIIKTILINLLYVNVERIDILHMIEASELESGEYTFIDIVVPIRKYIDLSDVESVLTQYEIETGVAMHIWDLITKNNEIISSAKDLTNDEKILELFDSKIIVPIVEDFLLYHKDTERYDKSIDDKTKKKDDTKIKYIVNKIDTFSNYYSDTVKKNKSVLENIKKFLYVPMANKFVILINNTEEIKIINKLLLQGIRSTEGNEFYNDLISYRQYPYINFKDFNNDGFPIMCNRTINVIRATSFETVDKHVDINSLLQTRIGSKDQILHVIGLAYIPKKIAIECIKSKSVHDIHISDNSKNIVNGYDNFIGHIQKILNAKEHEGTFYWLFDHTKDMVKLETYEQTEKYTSYEYCKYMVASLYNSFLKSITQKMESIFKNNKNVTLQRAFQILSKYDKYFIKFPKTGDIYKQFLHKLYFDYCVHSSISYDKNDDILHGIYGDIIMLPSKKITQKDKLIVAKINLDTIIREAVEYKQSDKLNVLCQHFVTWDQLIIKKRKAPGEYIYSLREFILTYVTQNFEQDFVCKSCGTLVNIKKYVSDGVFDDTTQHFVAFGLPIDVPLEELHEYEKYNITIRNIERVIEKISAISNIPYFVGSSMTIKLRRRSLIKDVIDLILLHNELLDKERRGNKGKTEMIVKKYGVNKDLSDLFVFELDNNIFKFSSQEKDYYKHLKYNNILTYLMILMILELNDSHITFMYGDKICNYNLFNKFKNVLFGGLKIITNNKNDLADILNYPVLCYMLYIISYGIVKYKMWFHETEQEKKPKKFDPIIQKIIIQTFVDLLNSILNAYEKNKSKHIYEIIFVKFNQKKDTTFVSKDIIQRLITGDVNTGITLAKQSLMHSKYTPMVIPDKFAYSKLENITYTYVVPKKVKIPTIKHITRQIEKITCITNCLSGESHKWELFGKNYKCKKCNIINNTVKCDNDMNKEIYKKAKRIVLEKLGKIYCVTGRTHIFKENGKSKICELCKYVDDTKLSDKQLEQLDTSLNKATNVSLYMQNTIDEKYKKIEKYYDKVVEYLKSNYGESKVHKDDYYKFITDFIALLQSIVGDSITINNVITHMKDNLYIIDHDHLGFPLEKPIMLLDQQNKIFYKNDHHIFKTDVLYYINYTIGKIEVYYDVKTLILLGYKEQNKDFVILKKSDRRIKIEYSLYNKIKYLGEQSKYINISQILKEQHENYMESQYTIQDAVSHICRKRISNLANIIYKFQTYINMIKNETTNKKENDDDIIFDITAYIQKLKNITLRNENGKGKIFKLWHVVTNKLHFKPLGDKTINISENDTLVNIEDIHKYNYHGNLLLFYIISEFAQLIDYNKNKVIKQNLVTFFVDFITYIHKSINMDNALKNIDIQRFVYVLNSSTYFRDLEKKGYGIDDFTTGIYGEYKDPSDVMSKEDAKNLEDAIEENDAVDMEGSLDYEDMYDTNYGTDERDFDPSDRYGSR